MIVTTKETSKQCVFLYFYSKVFSFHCKSVDEGDSLLFLTVTEMPDVVN